MANITKNKYDFIYDFIGKLEYLIPHAYTAKTQSEYLKKKKEELNEGEFVVIGDFSENYVFVIQETPQGECFSKKQCTIHPFCIYYRQSGEQKNQSLIIISEEANHFFEQVFLFKRKLVDYMKNKWTNVTKIFFFSDGAPTQYKNRKKFYDMCRMKIDDGLETEWAFFATGHGLFLFILFYITFTYGAKHGH